MALFFDVCAPAEARQGFVRVGLESDDPQDLKQSFWAVSVKPEEITLVQELLQGYTRWLDERRFLNFQEAGGL